MIGSRMDRVNAEIQKAISTIIANDLNNPIFNNQIISISKVETAPDFSQTKIFVSVFGDEAKQKELFNALLNCAGYIRKELSCKIDLKKTPKILFVHDKTIENANRIEEIINQLKGDKNE